MIKNTNNSPSLFSSLSDMLNQSHPLYQLADKIDWGKFETAFQPLYCQDNGRPGKPIRLMCGMLILKHLRNLSDESLREFWIRRIKKVQVVVYSLYVQVMAVAYPQKSNMLQAPSIDSL